MLLRDFTNKYPFSANNEHSPRRLGLVWTYVFCGPKQDDATKERNLSVRLEFCGPKQDDAKKTKLERNAR